MAKINGKHVSSLCVDVRRRASTCVVVRRPTSTYVGVRGPTSTHVLAQAQAPNEFFGTACQKPVWRAPLSPPPRATCFQRACLFPASLGNMFLARCSFRPCLGERVLDKLPPLIALWRTCLWRASPFATAFDNTFLASFSLRRRLGEHGFGELSLLSPRFCKLHLPPQPWRSWFWRASLSGAALQNMFLASLPRRRSPGEHVFDGFVLTDFLTDLC